MDECFRQGLLKKEKPDKAKVEESVILANHFLERAAGNQDMRYFDIALICAYNSMLQSARALLFRDGIKERSHVCIVSYLRQMYAKKGRMPEKFVNLLDITRTSRHKTLYAGRVSITELESTRAITDATEFLDFVKKLLL